MTYIRFITAITYACLTLSIFIVGACPALATTSEITPAERDRLLAQIEFLQQQLALLKARLADQVEYRVVAVNAYGETIPIEASYRVTTGGTLTPRPVLTNHQALFQLWNAVVATSTTIALVDTWQIFNDPETDLGAYVDTAGQGDEWRVAINRAGYNPRSWGERRVFAELFIHEYAHLLYFSQPDLTTEFGERFWTKRDWVHSESLASRSLEESFVYLTSYYRQNQNRFVSDYATLNVDEDMAETFLVLVVNPASVNDQSITARKQRFLMRDPKTTTTVEQLRANLHTLGLL